MLWAFDDTIADAETERMGIQVVGARLIYVSERASRDLTKSEWVLYVKLLRNVHPAVGNATHTWGPKEATSVESPREGVSSQHFTEQIMTPAVQC